MEDQPRVKGRIEGWVGAHAAQLRQGARMTVAGLLALGLGELFGLPRSYWAVLTAVLVTQASLGGSIRATVDRLIGTVAGAVYGAAVALAIPHQSDLGQLLATAAAIAPLALASALSPSFRIAPVTAIIVLLIPSGPQAGVVASAVTRVFEIVFGCVVGLACSILVLPSRAHQLVAQAAAAMAGLLADLTRLQLTEPGDESKLAEITVKQDQIRAALAKLDAVVGEARQERRSYLASGFDPEPLSRTLLRLRHDLVMVGRATAAPLPDGPVRERLQPRLGALAEAAAAALLGSARALTGEAPAPDAAPLLAAHEAYSAEVAALRQDRITRDLPNDAVERLFALGFALDQLCRNLGDFAARAEEQAQERA
jgi:uncharacterized membrane protein YccC